VTKDCLTSKVLESMIEIKILGAKVVRGINLRQ